MQGRAFQDIVALFPGQRILIVGDVMLDEYIWGEMRRISPEAPVPIVEIRRRTYLPGGAANAAANVVSLEGQAWLGGIIGRDGPATLLCETLQQHGVDPEGLVIDAERPTTTKTRLVAHNQQVVRVDSEQRAPLRAELEDRLLRWVERRIGDAHACILSDYDKGVMSARLAEHCIRLARASGTPVIVDPKGINYAKYRGATVVTPNVYEAGRMLSRDIDGEADLPEVGRRLIELCDGGAVVLTRGPQGMSLFRHASEPVHIPALARHVFDVTGAGDTVVSALAMALAAGATLEQATYLANRAAGIVVGKFGTATLSMEELLSDEVLSP